MKLTNLEKYDTMIKCELNCRNNDQMLEHLKLVNSAEPSGWHCTVTVSAQQFTAQFTDPSFLKSLSSNSLNFHIFG